MKAENGITGDVLLPEVETAEMTIHKRDINVNTH